MKSSGQALLIVIATMPGVIFAGQTLAFETPPSSSNDQEECIVDEGSDCAQRCLTEHNCCIKSCNWVEPKKKSKCIKQCKSTLKKCYRGCDEQAAVETAKEAPGA